MIAAGRSSLYGQGRQAAAGALAASHWHGRRAPPVSARGPIAGPYVVLRGRQDDRRTQLLPTAARAAGQPLDPTTRPMGGARRAIRSGIEPLRNLTCGPARFAVETARLR